MEKNGTKTEYHGTPPKKFGKSNAVVLSLRADLTIRKMSDSVWHFLMYVGNRYIGCIYRDTCTTLSYIRRIIFGGDENCDLSLPMKNSSEPASAMPGHALLLAMDDFFR